MMGAGREEGERGGGLVARGGGLVGNGLEEEDSGEEQPPLVYLRFLAANAHILSDAQLILTGQSFLTFAEI